MIDPKLTYAVVWASNNTDKYGYKVFKDLIDKGFKAIAINPNESEILWKEVYSTLLDYYDKYGNIDIAIFVVPPVITLEILKKIKTIKIKSMRFQPWAESEDVINFCKKNNIDFISNSCIMIQSNLH